MFCQTVALSFLGVFLLSQVDLAAGVKCYTCTRDLSDFPKIPTPFANDPCISRDGKKILDASAFKVTTDCADSTQICGSEFRWVVSTTDPSVGSVDTFTLTRGCFTKCPDPPGGFNCGTNTPGPKNTQTLPGTNMTIRSYDMSFRSLCTTDYCNAHPLGGLYMGLLDGNGYGAPSHGTHLAAAALPIALMFLVIMIVQ